MSEPQNSIDMVGEYTCSPSYSEPAFGGKSLQLSASHSGDRLIAMTMTKDLMREYALVFLKRRYT